MTRISRSAGTLGLTLVALIGLGAGIVLGVRYYNHHVGDWRIGLTAVAITLGVAIGAVVAAVVVWLTIDFVVRFFKDIFRVSLALTGASLVGLVVGFSVVAEFADLWRAAWWPPLVAAVFPIGMGVLVWRDRDRGRRRSSSSAAP